MKISTTQQYNHANRKIDPRFEAALEAVDRQHFISCEDGSLVAGKSIPTSETLKQIFSVLTLPDHPGVLHVGAGLGYPCAVLAKIANRVVGIEKIASLADAAMEKINRLKLKNVIVLNGEGAEGAPQFAPFDIIMVTTPNLKSLSTLLHQLAPGGQLVCVERTESTLLRLVKYAQDEQQKTHRIEQGLVSFDCKSDQTLIELGIVNREILNEARIRAKANNSLIIDEVRQLINVDDMALYRSLAKRYNLELGNVEILLRRLDPAIFNRFSQAFLDHHRLIPLFADHDTLRVATSDPDASMDEIQQVFPRRKLVKILVTPTDFRRLWSATDLSVQAHTTALPDYEEKILAEKDQDLLGNAKPEVGAHLISLFEAMLLDAVAERASDLHIEQYHRTVRIRLRVDGELRDLPHYDISPGELRGLINVIKLRADLNIAERRLPQGGRSRLRVGDALFDLRIQMQPSLHAEHVVIRLLPQNSELISIDKLGLSSIIADNYRRLLRNPAGLVLVVGPTGSGKSTTLYAGLQLLADDGTRKVITVEDPIEYSIKNIQQTRVRPEIGFNFADAMRSFVRQDPDVILVGEIRDNETAVEAMRASQTGHVVLSTLHCNDAVDAMQRLYDLGVHPNSLASELLAVIAQRLAKRICLNCRVPAEPDKAILQEVFPDGTPHSFRSFIGKGCEQCNDSGTHGRMGVVEYLHINPELRNAIARHIPVGELRKLALDCGLVTMRDSALDHVIQGNIPLSELPRILPAERMAPEARWQWEKPS
ncbi:ATPase, T2SS/T4P/T4SS family [Porticoccus sp.]|uniref:ATPase, T2SS/T4P/T4SS family n=1 Tax=Porticoccus sp. TaxID=2024853 RepID=UPI003F69C6E5